MNQNNPATPEAIAAAKEIENKYLGIPFQQTEKIASIIQKHYAAKDAEIERLRKKVLVPQNWTVEDPGMLREQIRVADVAYNHLVQERDQLTARVAELEKALKTVVDSACPHPMENGSMYEAWHIARKALAATGVDALTRLQELERKAKALDWLEKQSQKFRDTYALVASEAPSIKPGWKYYADGVIGDSLLSAIESAMEKQA